MRGPRCEWLRVKLVAPTSQAAALFYGQLFEIAPAVKSLLRGDMTEQGCKLMATLGVVVNSLGNLEAVLPAASALAKRHVDGAVNRGIVVDDHLVTSTSDVFAIGDAEHRGVCYGLAEPTNEQARALAERLAGRDARSHPQRGPRMRGARSTPQMCRV
jgi:hemoglobin-like flavoprotein